MRTVVLLALGLFLIALSPVLAQECQPGSSDPELVTPTCGVAADPCLYADNDLCIGRTCHVTIWVYEESNAIPGLQRQDEVVDNTCNGQIPGDTIIF